MRRPACSANPIYRELSTSLGVNYEAINAPAAPGCNGRGRDAMLTCNVTVPVGKVAQAVRRAAEWTAFVKELPELKL
jgi:hypothetical protein